MPVCMKHGLGVNIWHVLWYQQDSAYQMYAIGYKMENDCHNMAFQGPDHLPLGARVVLMVAVALMSIMCLNIFYCVLRSV